MEFGHTFVFLVKFQFIGFNEGVWICKNSMAFVKNIEFWVVFSKNSIKLPKNDFEGRNG
jgi:hypothetical protein